MREPTLPHTRPLPPDTFTVRVDRTLTARAILTPPELIVVFRVLDPDPDVSAEESKHPHKAYTDRTVEARFALNSDNDEERFEAEQQFKLLAGATSLGPNATPILLLGEVLRVRVARVHPRRNPSTLVSEAVEFLPL